MAAVDSLKAQQVDFIKVQSLIPTTRILWAAQRLTNRACHLSATYRMQCASTRPSPWGKRALST